MRCKRIPKSLSDEAVAKRKASSADIRKAKRKKRLPETTTGRRMRRICTKIRVRRLTSKRHNNERLESETNDSETEQEFFEYEEEIDESWFDADDMESESGADAAIISTEDNPDENCPLEDLLQKLGETGTVDETDPIPQKKRKQQKWKNRIQDLEKKWDTLRDWIIFHLIAFQFPTTTSFCCNCNKNLDNKLPIKCETCRGLFCCKCDAMFHYHHPFHVRLLFRDGFYKNLLPDQIIKDGNLSKREVPCPLFVPSVCGSCNSIGRMTRVPGDSSLIVVTLEGRFDVDSCSFKCLSCSSVKEASKTDYFNIGFWSGSPEEGESSYLFSCSLLKMWYYTKHNTPGTSEMKFIETIEDISREYDRNGVITHTMFSEASRQFDFFDFFLNAEIKKKVKFPCLACGKSPKCLHADGDVKLYRFDDSNQNPSCTKSLLEDRIISSDTSVSDHEKKINDVIPPKSKEKGTCGASQYKAGREDSSKFRNLDETGFLMGSCRHGPILAAFNMFAGENYRLVHYVHHLAFKMNVKFFCYDVICKYWPFAVKVSGKLQEYAKMITKITPFLSRFHGRTHDWICQLLNTGHWKEGAGTTTGEEQEQTNAKMSRYANSTKYMGKAARNDHLSHAIFFWNQEKQRKMPKMLSKRLVRAKSLVTEYARELEIPLKGKSTADMKRMANQLKEEYSRSIKKRRLENVPHKDLEDELEGLFWMKKTLQKRISIACDGAKSRNALRRKEALIKLKADRVISALNSNQNHYKLTYKDFESGKFPWQLDSTTSFKRRYNIINSWMLFQRNREEVKLVKKEMVQYIQSLFDLRSELKTDINEYTEKSKDTEHAQYYNGRASIARKELARLSVVISEAANEFRGETAFSTESVDDALEAEDEEALEVIEEQIEELLKSMA